MPVSMTESDSFSIPSAVREQAIRWRMRLQSGEATALDQEQLQAWLAEHPLHRQEYERLSTMWSVLKEVKPLLKADLVRIRSESATEQSNRSSAVPRVAPVMAWRWGRATVAAGACMALLVVASWWWFERPEAILYETVTEPTTK